MEIKAKATLNFEAAKALAHVTLCKRRDPKKYIITEIVICAVLVALTIWAMFSFGMSETMGMLCGCLVILCISLCALYFMLPKTMYNTLSKLKDSVNEYTFYDDMMRVVTRNGEFSGESEIKYSYIYKVFETSEYLFLYQTKNQALVVDKKTFENGTAADLRGTLQPLLAKKYIICNY